MPLLGNEHLKALLQKEVEDFEEDEDRLAIQDLKNENSRLRKSLEEKTQEVKEKNKENKEMRKKLHEKDKEIEALQEELAAFHGK